MSAISDFLQQQNIIYLYHFTDIRNLKSIFDNRGLLSHRQLEIAGSTIKSGGDTTSISIAKRLGLDDYISLSFSPYTPMSYRRKQDRNLCFFRFRMAVAETPGAIFCDANANGSGTNRQLGLQGLKEIKFSVIKSGVRPGNTTWHKYGQAEVLIPINLGFEELDSIIFVNDLGMAQALDLNYSSITYPMTVDRLTFVDDPSVYNEVSYNTIENIRVEGAAYDGEKYIIDRSAAKELIFYTDIRAVGAVKAKVTSQCKSIQSEREGTFVGNISIPWKYKVKSLDKQEYLINFWLDGSFWRRRVVMVN